MAKAVFENIEDLGAKEGQEIYVSDWIEIQQDRIQKFAEATGDFQWIHVDVERSNRESPFGKPIAHGYLTLSMLAMFGQSNIDVKNKKNGVNYGMNRVRFMNPVKVGSRIRARSKLLKYEVIPGGAQFTWESKIEIEGEEKPALVAETMGRMYK
jgi:acyl dehydratase